MTNIKIFFEYERLEIQNVQHGGNTEEKEKWNTGKMDEWERVSL